MKKSIGREYLEDVEIRMEYFNDNINRKIERLTELRSNAQSLSAVSNNERVQTSSSFDKTSELLSKIEELEKAIDELIERKNQFVDSVTARIYPIENDTLVNVLIDRYIWGKSDSQIAIECGITDRGVRKRAVRALSEFDKIYKKS